MKLGIIGGGVVGAATARCYLEFVEQVRVYDLEKRRATHRLVEVLECDLIMACLPTPAVQPGAPMDTSVLEYFFQEQLGSRRRFAIRSTVPIGFTRRMCREYDLPNLIHCPEFLTARCAYTDAQIPSRNIVGMPTFYDRETSVDYDNETGQIYLELLRARFGSSVPTLCCTSNESEAIKLMTNAFFAVKVSFFNEIRSLCLHLGLPWKRVLEGIMMDGRIAHDHNQVPGPDGKPGFGGQCLPKDLAQLISQFDAKAGVFPMVLTAAFSRNSEVDRK